ncbi:hypothetical protein, partial [Aquitalea magnusonii]|uniref:hypothetical protein n=1 Tax=Aquitalea magnusonii TaxID=332411 RepID=UPI000AA3DDE4
DAASAGTRAGRAVPSAEPAAAWLAEHDVQALRESTEDAASAGTRAGRAVPSAEPAAAWLAEHDVQALR